MKDPEHEMSRLNWEIVKAAIDWRKTHHPKMENAEKFATKRLMDAIDAREEFARIKSGPGRSAEK